MPIHSQNWFSRAILAFAGVLGCHATWILAPEFIRSIPNVPTELGAAAALDHRNAASWAASIGLIRGDLWAEYALGYADPSWNEGRRGSHANDGEIGRQALLAAERAVSYAPHNARVWLLLATLETRFSWLSHKTAASLKMSFYTGPNEVELIPSRLLVSVSSEAVTDTEIQQFVRHEIRAISSAGVDLRPALAAAYRDAPPAGKQLIEDTLKELDANLLAWIRSSSRAH